MLPVQFYYAILLPCCLYAVFRGGAPERIGATIFAIASLLTTVALSASPSRYEWVELGVLAVDVAMLFVLTILALYAERFWPLWVTALQAIGTAGHAVKMADPEVIRSGYAFALAFWSYPMLLLLVLGTWNHQKRLAKFGADPSWSSFSSRSALGQRVGPIA